MAKRKPYVNTPVIKIKKKQISIISDMIEKEENIYKKEILKELKLLNKKAYEEMRKHYYDFKRKYKQLQHTDIWLRARELLLDYFTHNSILVCPECGKVMDFRSATLHHNEYKDFELFTPDFVSFVHPQCHSKIHRKKYNYQPKI